MAIAVTAGVLVLAGLSYAWTQRASSPVPPVVIDEENGLQTVLIRVGKDGYQPSVLELKAHMMTKLNFRLETDASGMDRLLSPDLNFEATLKTGDNYFLIGNPQPGTYRFQNEDGTHVGYLVVQS